MIDLRACQCLYDKPKLTFEESNFLSFKVRYSLVYNSSLVWFSSMVRKITSKRFRDIRSHFIEVPTVIDKSSYPLEYPPLFDFLKTGDGEGEAETKRGEGKENKFRKRK